MFQRQELTPSLNRVMAIEFPNCDPAFKVGEPRRREYSFYYGGAEIIIRDIVLSPGMSEKFVDYFTEEKLIYVCIIKSPRRA